MKFLQEQLGRFFWFSVALYGIIVTVYAVLHLTVGERFIIVAWMNNGAYLLWAGAIILLIPCIVFRRFCLMVWMILPTLAFTPFKPMFCAPPEAVTIVLYGSIWH